jgi:hypothetical protein
MLKWLGIAYSGNSMRASFWSDVAYLQPAQLQLLQTYAAMDMTVIGDCLGSSATLTGSALSSSSQTILNNFFAAYGNLIQYYEVSNEPDNFGPSQATVQAIAQYVAANKPSTVQEVAPGWAFDGWEATNANRLAIEAYADDINGHAYGTSYMNNNGGSFMENLSAYGGSPNSTYTGTLNNGFPKPFIDTEMGANNWHTDLTQFSDTQPHAGAFDRDLRSYIAVADRFTQHASMFNDGGLNDYAIFNPPSDWSTLDPTTISVDPGDVGEDSRLQVYRRLALSYATHGTPLPYTLTNLSSLQYKEVSAGRLRRGEQQAASQFCEQREHGADAPGAGEDACLGHLCRGSDRRRVHLCSRRLPGHADGQPLCDDHGHGSRSRLGGIHP